MSKNTLHKILENLDGYLFSIQRNVETSMYELEVGFRKNWVFKSTDDVECETIIESDNGTLVKIYGKHDEVIEDDLIDFVNKVIATNKKITEMQKKFDKELEDQKEIMVLKTLKFDEAIAEFKDSSFELLDEDDGKDEEVDAHEEMSSDNEEVSEEDVVEKIK